jgi:hypothetical protein
MVGVFEGWMMVTNALLVVVSVVSFLVGRVKEEKNRGLELPIPK